MKGALLMTLEEKCWAFHKYVSKNNLPLEAITVGNAEELLFEMHYSANAPRNIYSHTKSFTVTAVGIAIDEGKLSLEDRLVDAFPDKVPAGGNPGLEKIRLKHLLCMSSGFGRGLLMSADRRPGVGAPDYEAYMLSQPVIAEPGEAFCYSSADSILAAHMVERAVGKRIGEYLFEKVFTPMEMGWPLWEHDPQGHANGGGGMFLTCSEMMKLGQLYLSGGKWKGERIVSESWVKEVSTHRFTFSKPGDPWAVGYGYQFWMSPYPGSYRADGAFGQITTILPESGLVVSIQCPERGNFEQVKQALHREFLSKL